MKRVILGLFCCAGLVMGQATVTIADTLKTPDGANFNGALTIVLKYAGPLSTASYSLTAGLKRVQVANGSLSVTLTPNSSITPAGTSYSVRYSPANGSQSWDEIWVVPSSPTTTTVRAIRSSTTPQPTVILSPQQISVSGASPGQALIYNGTSIAWGSVAVGSVGWGSITGTPGLQSDLAPYVRTLLSAQSPIVYNSLSGLISCPTCGSGGGDVSSVFGRTGAVVASSGDYSAYYAALSHVHIIGNVTGLQDALDAKASSTHQHNGGDITSGLVGPAYLGSGVRTGAKFLRDDGTWQNASGGVSTVFGRSGDVVASSSDYSSFYAALSHVHLIADVTGLQAALDGKASSSHAHAGSDITSGTVGAARLGSGSPSSANYLRGDGAWSIVAYGELSGVPSSFTPSSHTHTASDLTTKTGAGPLVVTAAGVPSDGCAAWSSGQLGSSASPCGTGGGSTSSVASATQSFTSQTSVTITHNFNSLRQVVACYDGSAQQVFPNTFTAGLATSTVTFSSAQTGSCTVLGGTGLYSQAFTSQTSVSLTHNLSTQAVIVACYDGSNQQVVPNTVVATSTSAATVTFSTAQTGSCVVAASLALTGGSGGSGTVTSVAVALPSEFSVSGSPITSAGTITGSWASQTQAKVFASPASTTGTPAFRALVLTDLPTGLTLSYIASGAKTGSGSRMATATSVPSDGCATWASGEIGSTGTPCGSGSGGWSYTAGDGIDSASLAAGVVAVDSTVPAVAVSGSQSLTFGTINASSCATQNITATGAAIGDRVAPGYPATLPDGLMGMMFVSATNTVQVRLCKITTGSADVTGLTFSYQIIRAR